MNYKIPHIYRRQIIATGKYYIGKHKGGDKYYKGSGKDYKIDLKLYKDFKTEILEYVNNISELNKKEEYWLEKFDAANNPLYYNKTNKSFGPIKQTKQWKLFQSNRMKGKSTTKGKKWVVKDTSNMKGGGAKNKTWKWKISRSEEQKNKISKSLKNRDTSSWNQKIYTKDRNTKISKTKGEGIIQMDLQGNFIKEYVSLNEAKKDGYLGIQGAIERNKPYKNYIWKRKKDILN